MSQPPPPTNTERSFAAVGIADLIKSRLAELPFPRKTGCELAGMGSSESNGVEERISFLHEVISAASVAAELLRELSGLDGWLRDRGQGFLWFGAAAEREIRENEQKQKRIDEDPSHFAL